MLKLVPVDTYSISDMENSGILHSTNKILKYDFSIRLLNSYHENIEANLKPVTFSKFMLMIFSMSTRMQFLITSITFISCVIPAVNVIGCIFMFILAGLVIYKHIVIDRNKKKLINYFEDITEYDDLCFSEDGNYISCQKFKIPFQQFERETFENIFMLRDMSNFNRNQTDFEFLAIRSEVKDWTKVYSENYQNCEIIIYALASIACIILVVGINFAVFHH